MGLVLGPAKRAAPAAALMSEALVARVGVDIARAAAILALPMMRDRIREACLPPLDLSLGSA